MQSFSFSLFCLILSFPFNFKPMAPNIMVVMKMIKCMVKDIIYFQMELDMLVHTSHEEEREREREREK